MAELTHCGGADGGGDALATVDAGVCVGGSRQMEAMEPVQVTELMELTVVETLWPQLMLVSVSVEAD